MFGLRSKSQPIGLDLGHDSVKMLQLEVNGTVLRVRAASRRALEITSRPPGELVTAQAADAIKAILDSGGFHGRSVVAALPRQLVHVKNLRLPQMPVNELASVVQFESRNIFPFDDDEAQVEFLPAGEVRQGAEVRQEVIVFAVRRNDVDRYVEELHHAGVEIDSLDIEPCALYREIERFVRRREDEQEVHVLIDIGMHRTQVVIGKGRDFSFYKLIELGGARFNESVSRKLGITIDEARALRRRLWTVEEPGGRRDPVRQAVFDATRTVMEDLAKEISLCMRYYLVTFRGQRPGRARLLGGEANDSQLLGILNSTLNMPVEPARPLLNVNCDGVKGLERNQSAQWATALGLALRHTTGKFPWMDGTPRSSAAAPPVAAEVVDLNVPIPPPRDARDNREVADHFAAVRRASAPETPATQASGKEALHA